MNKSKIKQRKKVKIGESAWEIWPGKILILLLCIMPFFTRSIPIPDCDLIRNAYFMKEGKEFLDFEQLGREFYLAIVAGGCLVAFGVERIKKLSTRKLELDRLAKIIFISLAVYLFLGLLSTLFSECKSAAWIGVYMLYEGYLGILSYGIVFYAAWYWCDKDVVLKFVRSCVTTLSILFGVLTVFEQMGYLYYNNSIVHVLSGMTSYVGTVDTATLTFGNSDYLGVFCAMLLPLTISYLDFKGKISEIIMQALAVISMGYTLLMTEVMSDIVIGFGLALVYVLVWVWKVNQNKLLRFGTIGVSAVVILGCGFGYVNRCSGNDFSEKLEVALVGMENDDNFGLLYIDIDGSTLTFKNKTDTLEITQNGSLTKASDLIYAFNGTEITPVEDEEGTVTFEGEALKQVSATEEDGTLKVDFGYTTPVEADINGDTWQVIGIGGTVLDEVEEVGSSTSLRSHFTWFNGRLFVWANTFETLKDCIFIGHGPATSVLYLNQNDLPILLNIFGQYVLFDKPHNWYLQMAHDTGVVSLAAVLVFLVLLFAGGFKLCFSKKYSWNPQLAGLCAGLFSYCILGIFNDSMMYQAPMFWFLCGLTLRYITITKNTKEL